MKTATSQHEDHVVVTSRAARPAWSEIRHYCWEQPVDKTVQCADVHMVDLCLTPRPQGACARFTDKWSQSRFEPIGAVFLLPAGFAAHTRAEAGAQKSVITCLNTKLISNWLEQDQAWSDRVLSSSLDIPAPQVRNLLIRLAQELEFPGLASEAMIELINMQLALELGRFVQSVPEAASGGLSPWRLRLIDERIADGRDAPSLTELAELVTLSVRHLTRGFRESRGIPIGTYIEQRRLAEARRLLQSDKSIKEIAYLMGYASQSGFSYAFRRSAGEKPQSYRTRTRGKRRSSTQPC